MQQPLKMIFFKFFKLSIYSLKPFAYIALVEFLVNATFSYSFNSSITCDSSLSSKQCTGNLSNSLDFILCVSLINTILPPSLFTPFLSHAVVIGKEKESLQLPLLPEAYEDVFIQVFNSL